MSDTKRRLAKVEQQAAADGRERTAATRCREAAAVYLDLLRALRPDYKLAKPLPPPSLPIARARMAFSALMAAIAAQGPGQSTGDGQPNGDDHR